MHNEQESSPEIIEGSWDKFLELCREKYSKEEFLDIKSTIDESQGDEIGALLTLFLVFDSEENLFELLAEAGILEEQ